MSTAGIWACFSHSVTCKQIFDLFSDFFLSVLCCSEKWPSRTPFCRPRNHRCKMPFWIEWFDDSSGFMWKALKVPAWWAFLQCLRMNCEKSLFQRESQDFSQANVRPGKLDCLRSWRKIMQNNGGIFSVSLVKAEDGILSIGCTRIESGRSEAVSRWESDGDSIHWFDGSLRFSCKSVRTKEAMQRHKEVLEPGKMFE